MKRIPYLAVALILASCGSETVTGPSPVPEKASAPEAVATTPTPVVPAPTPSQVRGTINGASWEIANTTGTYQVYVARLYEVINGGEQQLRFEIESGQVPPGEKWGGSFPSLPCNYQIDLDNAGPVRHPAPGYLGSKIVTGNVCPSPSPSPSPSPEPALCYYRVSCGQGFTSSGKGGGCTDQAQQSICEATGTVVKGVWRNFGPQNLQNHCQFPVPGVSLLNFQLNPGQSADGCLSKRDEN